MTKAEWLREQLRRFWQEEKAAGRSRRAASALPRKPRSIYIVGPTTRPRTPPD